jgi:anthranilate 1,2-dioxygenase small subunit
MADGQDFSALRARLRDFYDDYTFCLDDGQLERWPTFFTEDCRYRVISRENYDDDLPHATLYCDGLNMIKDRVTALRETTVYEPRSLRHLVGGLQVLGQEGDLIKATANFAIFESLSDREPVVNMVGRYVDAIVRDGSSFLFKDRFCVFDNYRIRTSLIIPV